MRLEPIPNPTLARRLGLPAAALVATVVVASLLALLAGANPFAVLGQIVTGAVGSKFALLETLNRATPLIFTGLRLSLGVGWMVLIAAEMLAQNPGLDKFVWDEFQNGSSSSLAKIMVAVLTIGVIGFLLDRVMYALQSLFTFSNNR